MSSPATGYYEDYNDIGSIEWPNDARLNRMTQWCHTDLYDLGNGLATNENKINGKSNGGIQGVNDTDTYSNIKFMLSEITIQTKYLWFHNASIWLHLLDGSAAMMPSSCQNINMIYRKISYNYLKILLKFECASIFAFDKSLGCLETIINEDALGRSEV